MLLKGQILEAYEQGTIKIEPFDAKNIGPNSYDVRLGDTLFCYDMKNGFLDCDKDNEYTIIEIPDDGYILQPNTLYLGYTLESVGTDYYVPEYDGRSSMGRLGLCSHISAGFGDIGFEGHWTLEITVVHPTKIYKHMRIGQIHFINVDQSYNTPDNRYKGKYSNINGPKTSSSYIDKNSEMFLSDKQ